MCLEVAENTPTNKIHKEDTTITNITKKHIVEDNYGFNVWYNADDEEIGRAGTGLTEQGTLSFALDLSQGIFENGEQDELLAELRKLRETTL